MLRLVTAFPGRLATVEREQREEELVNHLTKASSEAEEKKELEFVNRLETIRKNLRRLSTKVGKRWSIIISSLLSFGVIALFLWISIETTIHWTINLSDFLVLYLIWKNIRACSEKRVASVVYTRKLKETGLEDSQISSI